MLKKINNLTLFLLRSHQDGNPSHGLLYCGLPGEESPPGPPDPTDATSCHSWTWRKEKQDYVILHNITYLLI